MEPKTSAVDFPTRNRVHVALACRDVALSRAFYERLLGTPATKVRPGYVKFEVHEPPINLTLNETDAPHVPRLPAHFGIQVKSTDEVVARRRVMEAFGYPGRSEEGGGCCYAVQDKVWFSDPDGHPWEVFVVTQADTSTTANPSPLATPAPA